MRRICMMVVLLLSVRCVGKAFAVATVAPVPCEVAATRCSHDFVEVCDSRHDWSPILDCRAVVPSEWECGQLDGRHTCVKAGVK